LAAIDQIVVYKEGLPDSYQELERDELVVKIRRPVYELIICYEPDTGVIEVIAQGKEQRESIARLFSEVMLGRGDRRRACPVAAIRHLLSRQPAHISDRSRRRNRIR
jgi:hypothetical protein